jgi:hypothetical protein
MDAYPFRPALNEMQAATDYTGDDVWDDYLKEECAHNTVECAVDSPEHNRESENREPLEDDHGLSLYNVPHTKLMLHIDTPRPSQYYVNELEYDDWPSGCDELLGQATGSCHAFGSSFTSRHNSSGFTVVAFRYQRT